MLHARAEARDQQHRQQRQEAAHRSGQDESARGDRGACRQQSPLLTQVKFLGSYQIPKIDVLVSGALQSVPGPQVLGNFVATNALLDSAPIRTPRTTHPIRFTMAIATSFAI